MSWEKVTQYADSGTSQLEHMKAASYPDGVAVDPTPITAGQRVTIFYDGLLSKSGADSIWLHCGYGPNNSWHVSKTIQMNKTGWGYEKSFDVMSSERMNFCFKDSANHWDNNNGMNWSYEIHNGQ